MNDAHDRDTSSPPDDPKKAMDEAVQLLRSENRAVDEVPTLVIRPRTARRDDRDDVGPTDAGTEATPRLERAATTTPMVIVDGYGTMTFATPSASMFLSGNASTMLVGRSLDRFVGPADPDQVSTFATILGQLEDEAVVLACTRRGDDGEPPFSITIERVRSVLRVDSFVVSFAASKAPATDDAESDELALAVAIAEIGMALVDEATFDGFLRRSAKALREATEADGLRIITKLGVRTVAGAKSEHDAIVVDRASGSPAVGSHLLAASRIDLPLCAIEVLGNPPTARAASVLARAARRLSSAIAKRWAEDRLVSLASQFTLLDAISTDLCSLRASTDSTLRAVARHLGHRPGSACVIELWSDATSRVERVVVDAGEHGVLGALERIADDLVTGRTAPGVVGDELRAELRGLGIDPSGIISAPIRRVGSVLGSLHVIHLGRFVDDGRGDEVFLRAIGDRLGLALSNTGGDRRRVELTHDA